MILRTIKVLTAIILWIVSGYFVGTTMGKSNFEINMFVGLITAPLLLAITIILGMFIFVYIMVPIINYIAGKDCFHGKFTDDGTTVFGDD